MGAVFLWFFYWGHIRCFGCCRWRFRSYSESLFQTPKRNQKAWPPAYGTSPRLSVPSLRCPSGGIAYGLLRCTSSRCMRLRRTALRASPLMDTSARPAEGAKNQEPEPEPDQEPLTLALPKRRTARRERELIEWFGRGSPTCDTALNSGFEKHKNRPPLLGERAGVRSSPTETKAKHAPLLPTQNDER
ncbi:UNVERIFIED_ORG: hypothetical protein J2X80_000222 [Pseudomonas fluorescens]|nr:hypothetical protein [Pseudomonas fluorescens]